MFAVAFHTTRHYLLFTFMACLCVSLGGPSYAAGVDSLFIAGATYYEPGASGPGWAWTDAVQLEFNGYTGEAIGADGDLAVARPGSLPSMRPGWMLRAPTAASPAWAGRLHPRASWRLRVVPLAQAVWWMPMGPLLRM